MQALKSLFKTTGLMTLLEIGDTITPKKALKLCRYFGLADSIESDPGKYKG
jgi:hypothetical protein